MTVLDGLSTAPQCSLMSTSLENLTDGSDGCCIAACCLRADVESTVRRLPTKQATSTCRSSSEKPVPALHTVWNSSFCTGGSKEHSSYSARTSCTPPDRKLQGGMRRKLQIACPASEMSKLALCCKGPIVMRMHHGPSHSRPLSAPRRCCQPFLRGSPARVCEGACRYWSSIDTRESCSSHLL